MIIKFLNRSFFFVMAILQILSLSAIPTEAQSNIPIPNLWIPDAEVRTMISDGTTLYIGGVFTNLSPNTGPFIGFDSESGDVVTDWPLIRGTVNDAAPDGQGGWIIGGEFSNIGGQSRTNLARIMPDGSLSQWDPSPNGEVFTIEVVGNIIYLGGDFTQVNGVSRSRIAAIDLAGQVESWDPGANNTVLSILVTGNTLFAGGSFTLIGGQNRNRLAAVDTTSGLATSWNPDMDSSVWTLALGSEVIYAGGNFTTVAGQTRNHIAAINTSTGMPSSWDPNSDNVVTTIAVEGSLVLAGGFFSTIGGSNRTRLAAIDASTGIATSWDPSPSGTPYAISVDSGIVYIGGGFSTIEDSDNKNLAAFDVSTGGLQAWRPRITGRVNHIEVLGGVVYAAGSFKGAGGVTRNRLAAIDLVTGEPTSWDPDIYGWGVLSLALDSETLYVGGDFSSVGSPPTARNNLASFNSTTGVLNSWNPSPDWIVWRVEPGVGTVYVGGNFQNIGSPSVSRRFLAELDPITGAASAWNPDPNSSVTAIQVSGTTMYIGGTFTNLNSGLVSRNRLGAVDTTTGTATAWDPSASGGYPWDLLLDGDRVYACGTFTSIGGTNLEYLAAIDTVTGTPVSWDPNPNNNVFDMDLLSGGDVIAVGRFWRFGTNYDRGRIARLYDTNGVAHWNPDANGFVYTAEATGKAIYVGGSFSTIGGEPQNRLSGFCLESDPFFLEADSYGSESIWLNWEGYGNLFLVYRSFYWAGPYEKIGESNGTYFQDTNVHSGVTYYYQVTSMDTCESDPSNRAQAIVDGPCTDGPLFEGAAYAAQTVESTCTIKVAWWPADPLCGGPVTYDVYRSTSAVFLPGPATLIATDVSATSIIDSDSLSSGETYYYIVRATDIGAGTEDENLNRQAAEFACPPAQVSVDSMACGGSITTPNAGPNLEWSNTDNETGYEWQVWDGAGCSGSIIDSGSTTADITTDNATGLASDTYWWQVRAMGDGIGYLGSPWTCGCSFTVGGRVELIDDVGQPAVLYLENDHAFLRVTDPWSNGDPGTVEQVSVDLSTSYAADLETVTVDETGVDTGVFEGSIELDVGTTAADSLLQTGNSGDPSWTYDTITASYGTSVDTAQTVGSFTDFVNAHGSDASWYPPGGTVFVRVRDENINTPGSTDTTTVTVESLTTGDSETLTLTETGLDTGTFEGSITTEIASPTADGVLQVVADETIRASHTDANYPTESEDTAVMTSPCNETYSLSNNTWKQIALPCDPAQATVADVFGDDGLGVYGTDWAIIERDEAANSYRQLIETDTLVQGDGYWIEVISGDHDVSMDGAFANDTEPFEISVLGDASGLPNQIGHPFTFAVDWAEVMVDVGGYYLRIADLSATQASTVLMSAKWEYNGVGYDMCDPRAVCGEPDDPSLGTYDGFWVKAFVNTTLRIPPTAMNRSVTGLGNGEWYVRLLVASADGSLFDRSNLLGRLAGAADGQDSLDGQELSPFGSSYLVLVFPHDDWQGTAWSYTSDYREARAGAGGQWSFEVVSDSARATTLSWQVGGDAADILARSRLLDEETGTVISPDPGGTYTLTVVPGRHHFTWIVNSLPQVAAGSDLQGLEGKPFDLVAAFSDEDIDDTHTATISWGDGTVDAGAVDATARTVSGSHVYSEAGVSTIEICVADQSGSQGCNTVTVTVRATEIFADGFENGDTTSWSQTQSP